MDVLRSGGPETVAGALARAAGGGPAAVAVDAETTDDLAITSAGLRQAMDAGVPVAARCSPALAALLGGGVSGPVPPPPAPGGVLVVVGSYVPATTRQLGTLNGRTGAPVVEANTAALAGPSAGAEVKRLAEAAGQALSARRLAVIATPRTRPAGLTDLASGRRIAAGLARPPRGSGRPRPWW